MSHGVHVVQHEVEHELEHGGHDGGHEKKPADNQNRKIALLISVIALFLAFSETLGKSAQTAGIGYNVEAAMAKQIDAWQKTAQRYRSEPDTREGSIELMERAREAEHKRDTALARYHHYEVASAAYQIGIVLASAAVITGIIALAYAAGVLGLAGIAFTCIGFFAPHAVHLF